MATEQALSTWARLQLPALRDGQWQAVAGDASARAYFRLSNDGASAIAVLSPPESQKNAEFLAIRDLLASQGIRVPDLLAVDLDVGYFLLEDLGDSPLLPALNDDSADACYARAADILRQLNTVPDEVAAELLACDRPFLVEELERFPTWFVAALLGAELNRAVFDAFSQCLIDSALAQPRVVMHRDFHSRNLMCLPDGELALIDFQDAVRGPVTYDAVSLWRDCYIRWPEARVQHWAGQYYASLRAQGQLVGITEAQFQRWFDLMGLQRHIKVLGTFARLYLRDGKSAYLQDLPLVLDYVRLILSRYRNEVPEIAAFADWFETLSPVIEAQAWSTA